MPSATMRYTLKGVIRCPPLRWTLGPRADAWPLQIVPRRLLLGPKTRGGDMEGLGTVGHCCVRTRDISTVVAKEGGRA